MEKFINLKNKSVGYYLIAVNVVLALFLAIFFFITYKTSMPNNAAGQAPVTIAIFALGGLVVDLVYLFLPQYRFINIAGIVMFALSLFKEVLIIPALIADVANNVYYQGGNFPINLVYIIIQFVLVGFSIAVAFIGVYKDDAEEDQAMMAIKGDKTEICKASIGGVALVAALLVSSLVAADATRKDAKGSGKTETADPNITAEIKKAAEEYEYEYDPKSVLIKEQETYDYNDASVKNAPLDGKKDDAFIVYYFEGQYSEGWQGDYSKTYSYLYLYSDGTYGGKTCDVSLRGYWYNSSLAEGHDENGNDVVDCLNMVSNASNYESIITEEAGGFYCRQAYIKWGITWGTRSGIITGYYYYPEVALFIDSSATGTEYKVGDYFTTNPWVAKRVLKNLTYSAVYKESEVKWTVPSGMVDGDGNLTAAGEFEITATWRGFTATKTVKVSEAE